MNTHSHITKGYINIILPELPNDDCKYVKDAPLICIIELNLENLCVWAFIENENPILISRYCAFRKGKISGTELFLYYELCSTSSKITHHIYELPIEQFDDANKWHAQDKRIIHCIPNDPIDAIYDLSRVIISESPINPLPPPSGHLIFDTENDDQIIIPINFIKK